MGEKKHPEKTRAVFILKTTEDVLCAYSEIFSGEYDIIETSRDENYISILKKHFPDISVIIIDASSSASVVTETVKKIKSDDVLLSLPVIVIGDDSMAESEETFLMSGVSLFMTRTSKTSVVLLRTANLINLRESAESGTISEYDEITGLYNRQAFLERAEKIVADNSEEDYVICIAELDGIKVYNEKNGKSAGDELFRSIGSFLKNASDPYVLAGRFAGDQFVVLLKKNDEFAGNIYSLTIRESDNILKRDIGVENIRIRFALYEDIEHDIPMAETCERALLALQTIRGKYGKTIARYEHSILSEHRKKERIESSMKEALEKNQFEVYYQPKHDVNTGELTGAEALIRWNHPEYGFMSPKDFIPVFENNGFISEVDNFVWKRTCQNLRKWISEGIEVVPISINASKLDFINPDFFDKIHEASTKMNVPPGLLHIEVTESLFSDQIEELVSILTKCQKNGYKIELDDFGSGYSSLNTLSILPLDIVKMDMSLVKAITNFKSMRVFSACINLAKSLGLKTVSEGVETNEQMWTIQELGGDSIQGYLYSRPLSEKDFEEYLKVKRVVRKPLSPGTVISK